MSTESTSSVLPKTICECCGLLIECQPANITIRGFVRIDWDGSSRTLVAPPKLSSKRPVTLCERCILTLPLLISGSVQTEVESFLKLILVRD